MTYFRKGFVFILGSLFLLFILEGILQLSYFSNDEYVNLDRDRTLNDVLKIKWERTDEDFVVAVYGNSYTYGTGTDNPKIDSYTHQLEGMLKRKYPNKKISVFNYALPSINSYVVKMIALNNLDSNADFVILRAGEANRWNPQFYDRYQSEIGVKATKSFIDNFRVTKFYRSLRYVINTQTSMGFGLDDQLKSAIHDFDKQSHLWVYKSTAIPSENFINQYQELLVKYPDSFEVSIRYLYLLSKLNRFNEISELLEGYFQKYRSKQLPLDEFIRAYQAVRRFWLSSGPGEARNFYGGWNDRFKAHSADSSNFLVDSLEQKKLKDWAEHDLNAICNEYKKKSPMLLLTYPPYANGNEPVANYAIRDVAQKLNIPLIDIALNFEKLGASGFDTKKLFSHKWGTIDNHLNKDGYAITAKLVFDYIMKERLVEKTN